MIRKTLVTLALSAGMVAGTAGVASAHECYVAKRSAAGDAAASHSANWYTLHLSELYAHAHHFMGGEPLTAKQIAVGVAYVAAEGAPTSFTVFDRFTLPKSLSELEAMTSAKSADGKGIDHFFAAYGEEIMGGLFAAKASPAV